jgi:hypothetical protein
VTRRPPAAEIGDIVEITSNNFKTFFLECDSTHDRVIALITRVEKGFDTAFVDEWIYYVALVNGEIFSLYVNEFKIIAKANIDS